MLIGHQKQRQYLRTLAQSGKLPHALLFAGERGLGKKTAALELVMALNCQNVGTGQKPCFVCRACSDIQKNQYPDLAVIEPEKKEIQISQIRDLIWRLSLRPYNSALKIAIINDAHLMNSEAQNCLLKTLEEPSGQALLILISEQPFTLLSTILSRMERINFYPVARKEIETALVSCGASADLAQELGEISMGRPGEAFDFLREPEKLKIYHQRLSEVSRLIGDDFTERFQYAKDLSEDAEAVKDVLSIWLGYFRNNLLLGAASGNSDNTAKTARVINAIEKMIYLIAHTNVNVRLALETLMLEL